MIEHYDDLETRGGHQREEELFGRLPAFLEETVRTAPSWAAHLENIEVSAIDSRTALASLPVLRKSELKALQESLPPFGGFARAGAFRAGRVFMSPGPIFEPQGDGDDPWGSARALFAAGFRPGDLVLNTFSYHMTPGGFILDTGARALGCTVIPAGAGNTDWQLDAIHHLKPVGYTGTPDFLKILLDKGIEGGKAVDSIGKALVSGAALPETLRGEMRGRGVSVLQCYAVAEIGVIAYESEALEGMILNENLILEIVRPGTNDPVEDGEVGEIVVTSFNPVYPMIRLGTGDLSAVIAGESSCGRTGTRIAGWMGRADQTTKVKGMFVHPGQIAKVAEKHPELGRVRLVVTREEEKDVMVLQVECASGEGALASQVAETLHGVTKIKGRVEIVPPGSLPNDGKVIADQRTS